MFFPNHFIETISEVEPDSLVEGEDPDRTEDPDQPLQNIRFKVTIRGWSHRANQHRVTTLLSLQDEPLVRRILENQVHGLPADKKTVYLWDSMDNQDRQNTLEKLKTTSEWTIWKTRDKEWSPVLQKAGFHQLLNIHKDNQSECWGFKIKGW